MCDLDTKDYDKNIAHLTRIYGTRIYVIASWLESNALVAFGVDWLQLKLNLGRTELA